MCSALLLVTIWEVSIRAAGPSSARGGGSDGVGDGLGLQVLLEAGHAHLAADAGLLVTAEGHVDGVPQAAVDAEGAGADRTDDALDACGVTAPHRPGQPVGRIVGDP